MSTAIERFLKKQNKIRIGVVGDAMIDEYFHVSVKRMSPEFPIPVMLSEEEGPYKVMPGGAANVAYQFRHFDVDAQLCSLIDYSAKSIFEMHGLGVSLCHNMEDLTPTHLKDAKITWGRLARIPRKKRIYDRDFPTYRWDVEKFNHGLMPDELSSCINALRQGYKSYSSKFDALVFSDYGKGLFHDSEEISWIDFVGNEIPTLVDPKDGNLEKWKGCTVFKPNAKEAEELSGETKWQDQCKYFKEKINCDSVVITQGGEGVVGQIGSDVFQYRPSRNNMYPESVIGAGDCFMAFMAMAVGHGFNIREAAEIAYEAGAVYVTKKHNEPVTPYQLHKQVDPIQAKFIEPAKLSKLNGVVFANGCFDILHRGHLETLKYAAEQGEYLVVALNSDSSVSRLKGPERPINPLLERMNLMASLDFVDFVVSFEEDTPSEIIDQICPDVIVKASDYKPEDVVGSDRARIVIAPLVEGLSTTIILEKLNRS